MNASKQLLSIVVTGFVAVAVAGQARSGEQKAGGSVAPFVVKGPHIGVNMAEMKSAEDLRRVPGIVRAWKTPGQYGNWTLRDINGDGEPECFGNDTNSVAATASDGMKELWRVGGIESTGNDNHLWCEDMDADGNFEVVIFGNDAIWLLDARTGSVKKKIPLGISEGGEKPWYIGHFSDRKKWDIVVLVRGEIRVYTAEGRVVFTYGKNILSGNILYAADLDGDGFSEIIHPSDSGNYVLDHDGKLLYNLGGKHSDGLLIEDFDGDGRLEICVQTSGCTLDGDILIVDAITGAIKVREKDDPAGHLQMFASGHFLPGDKGRQIFFAPRSDKWLMRAIDCRGKRLIPTAGAPSLKPESAGQPVYAHNHSYNKQGRRIAEHVWAADADGDGLDEVFISKGKKARCPTYVACYDGDGTLLMDVRFEGAKWACLNHYNRYVYRYVWDMNRNGRKEIEFQTDGWVILMEVPQELDRPRDVKEVRE
jgi:hypothetical protein